MIKNYIDWSDYEDAGMGDAYADIPKHGENWAKAIAVCINSKQCEDLSKQLMCPSYRVTQNPHLSPGGRVTLLKAALSSSPVDLLTPELAEAMELCVSCKGCKRECEANIDMPLIKAEYMAQKNAKTGVSIRSKLFAYTPHLLFYIPFIRQLIQLRNKIKPLAWLSEKWLGIAKDVSLPVPDKKPIKSIKNNLSLESQKQQKTIILMIDTFSRHFEPNIVEETLNILNSAGYYVIEAKPLDGNIRPLCCGRTYLAQGLIDKARQEAKRLIDALLPHVEKGLPVIGLEASCILGLREEALALGLGEDAVKVAKNVLLLEEFLAREIKSNRLDIQFIPPKIKSLIHGHCHQKAAGAMKSMRRVLKFIPEHSFEMIDSSCCGMAGTFGLEKEHVELSNQMADAQLLPTLANEPNATVIANGFSCRHKIKSHTQVKPVHLATFLAKNLLTGTSKNSDFP